MNRPKDYIPYKAAVVLEKLGFDKFSDQVYLNDGKIVRKVHGLINYPKEIFPDVVQAPFYFEAFRFFREKYNIDSAIMLVGAGYGFYLFHDRHPLVCFENPSKSEFTYELAEEACLNKLIEICEERYSALNLIN
jgi:hypothetical protein